MSRAKRHEDGKLRCAWCTTDPEYVAYLEPAIADFYAGRPVARKEAPGFGCAIQSVYYILPRHL